MRLRRGLMAAAVLVCGLAVGAVPAVASGAAAAPYCGITWGSSARAAGGQRQAPVVAVRTGRHDCYDRVVLDLDGTAAGYRVAYGEAYTQGRGLALSPYTAGGAVLNVVVLAPAGPPGFLVADGTHLAGVLGYRTLRDITYGGSFEGHTTFAVGVRARLPYRVFVLAGPGTHSRVVLDVAHRWTA